MRLKLAALIFQSIVGAPTPHSPQVFGPRRQSLANALKDLCCTPYDCTCADQYSADEREGRREDCPDSNEESIGLLGPLPLGGIRPLVRVRVHSGAHRRVRMYISRCAPHIGDTGGELRSAACIPGSGGLLPGNDGLLDVEEGPLPSLLGAAIVRRYVIIIHIEAERGWKGGRRAS